MSERAWNERKASILIIIDGAAINEERLGYVRIFTAPRLRLCDGR